MPTREVQAGEQSFEAGELFGDRLRRLVATVDSRLRARAVGPGRRSDRKHASHAIGRGELAPTVEVATGS